MAFFGGFGGAREAGFAFDLSGNVCVTLTRCDANRGVGLFAGLGGAVGIESGDFCRGDNTEEKDARFVDLGLGAGGAISVTLDGAGRPVGGAKAFGGVAVGGGGVSAKCQLRTVCARPFR